MWTVTLSRGEQVSALAMGLGAFGMVMFASYIEHGAVNWPMSGFAGLALFVLPHLTAFLVAVARDVAETVRKTAPDPIAPAQELILGGLAEEKVLDPILVHERETTRTITRISAGAEALALLELGMKIRGPRSLSLPGWRDMQPEWSYPRWSRAVRSLGVNLAPTSGGVGGGGTFVHTFNSLKELYDAVKDGRVIPHPESDEQESA